MRNIIALLSLLSVAPAIAQTPDWGNLQVVGHHKLPYHATLQLPSREAECREMISLDGMGHFRWSPSPDERIAHCYTIDYDATTWDRIAVPGYWQMQGYGKPIYTNSTSPFRKDAPHVMGEPDKSWYSYITQNNAMKPMAKHS